MKFFSRLSIGLFAAGAVLAVFAYVFVPPSQTGGSSQPPSSTDSGTSAPQSQDPDQPGHERPSEPRR